MAFFRDEVIASTALNASGNSRSVKCTTATNIAVGIDVTAVTGTSPSLTMWMQGTDDGGTTWYDICADIIAASSTTATSGTVTTSVRNVVSAKTTTTAEKFYATFRALPFDYVRLAWVMSGTTPSFTLSASVVGK